MCAQRSNGANNNDADNGDNHLSECDSDDGANDLRSAGGDKLGSAAVASSNADNDRVFDPKCIVFLSDVLRVAGQWCPTFGGTEANALWHQLVHGAPVAVHQNPALVLSPESVRVLREDKRFEYALPRKSTKTNGWEWACIFTDGGQRDVAVSFPQHWCLVCHRFIGCNYASIKWHFGKNQCARIFHCPGELRADLVTADVSTSDIYLV